MRSGKFMKESMIESQKYQQKFFFLMSLLVIMYLRSPQIFNYGRFWAEEANVYFVTAYCENPIKMFFYVYWRTGYYYLFANLASILSVHMVPIKWAPLVTTYLSAAVIVILLGIILFNESYLFRTEASKYTACFIALFAPSATGEVWVNTINSQVYFGMIAVVLLFINDDHISRKLKAFYNTLLFISGLSGLYAVVLIPLYALKTKYIKTKNSRIQLSILAVGTVIQGGIVVYSKYTSQLAETKLRLDPLYEIMTQTLYFDLITPLIGNKYSLSHINSFVGMFGSELFAVVFVSLLLSCVTIGAYLSLYNNDRKIILSLYGIFFILVCFTNLGAHGSIGGRYSVFPGFIVMIILMVVSMHSVYPVIRICAGIILFSSLMNGVTMYNSLGDAHFFNSKCPTWERQISEWEKNPNMPIKVWPFPGWQINIPSCK